MAFLHAPLIRFTTLVIIARSLFCHAHRVCAPNVACAPIILPICDAQEVEEVKPPRPTLPCTADAYITMDKVLYKMNLQTGETVQQAKFGDHEAGGEVNALGHNPVDNYLYGTRGFWLLRVLGNGKTENVVKLPFRPNMGTFDEHGTYWCSHGGMDWASVHDVAKSPTQTPTVQHGKGTGFPKVQRGEDWPGASDWAYTKRYPGYLFGLGVFKTAKTPALVRWSMKDHTWALYRDMQGVDKVHSFGAVMATSDGYIYGLETKSGRILRYHPAKYTSARILDAKGPVSNSTQKRIDGTRCLLLPDDGKSDFKGS